MLVALVASDGARAADDGTSQEIWLTGAAYGFRQERGTQLGFRLNTSTIWFKMAQDAEVVGWLRTSQQTGAFLSARIDPGEGSFEDASTYPTFRARRVAIKGDLRNVNPGSREPLLGPGAKPVPGSERALAEAIALRESGRAEAAGAFLDKALADSTLRPALKAVALRTRALIESPMAGFQGSGTPEQDRTLLKALADLDLAVSLAPEDPDSANERSYVLGRLGAYDEALAGLRASPVGLNEFTRLIAASTYHRWRREYALALADVDEIRKRQVASLGMPYHYNRGQALLGLGDYGQAVEEFTEGLKTQPGYSSAYFERACTLVKLGRPDDARKDIENAFGAVGPSFKNRPEADRVKFIDQAMVRLSADVRNSPDGPGPCLGEKPRAKSPLLAERAVAAKGPTPAPSTH